MRGDCIGYLKEILEEAKIKKWSGKVTKKVKKAEKPAEGTFAKSAEGIVKELMSKAEGRPGIAMKKLMFYINRAGKNLQNKTEINKAKSILSKKVEKEKK